MSGRAWNQLSSFVILTLTKSLALNKILFVQYSLLAQREAVSICTLVGDTGPFACNLVTRMRNRALSAQLKLAHLSPQPITFLLTITRKTQTLQKHKWELKFTDKNTIKNCTPPNEIERDSTKLNKLKDFTSTYSNMVDRTNLKDIRMLFESWEKNGIHICISIRSMSYLIKLKILGDHG